MAVLVPFASGGGALVDEEDAERVLRFRWHANPTKGGTYARSKRAGYLHRFLFDLQPGDRREVDHINGDQLDNRRSNLRVVTHAQNQQNRGRQARRTSRYRNVTWFASRRQWMVRVKVGGKEHFGGYFTDEDAAGRAARSLRLQLMPYAVD